MTFWKKQNYRGGKNYRPSGVENGAGEKLTVKGPEGIFGGDGIVPCLDGGGDYTIVYVSQNSQSCTLKRVNFTVCKLYIRKPDRS